MIGRIIQQLKQSRTDYLAIEKHLDELRRLIGPRAWQEAARKGLLAPKDLT